jgi:hypothetical protein
VARSENFEGSRVAFLEKRERCVGDVSREVKLKVGLSLWCLGTRCESNTSVAEVR